jgi:hypothetical protein
MNASNKNNSRRVLSFFVASQSRRAPSILLICISLLSLCGTRVVSAQSAGAVSPATVSQAGPFTSYQVNVDVNGNNVVGDAANTPSIAVDPTNPNRMAIGWRQFATVTSNFRQAGRAYTTNGGTSWISPGPLDTLYGTDPVLASDENGQFFYLTLFYDGAQQMYNRMWRSTDGGMSWWNIGPRVPGGSKDWFVIDTTASSIGHGFQYECWTPGHGSLYGNNQFSRSTDGGFTWMNPITIPNAPQWGTIDVDSNGNVFVAGVNEATYQVWCIRSSNAKLTNRATKFDQSTAVNLGGTFGYKPSINPEGLAGQINVAVDRSGTKTNNNVYMLASVVPTNGDSQSDVMFVRSTDGGATFSAPRRINDDPADPAKWHWLGAMSVAPNGRIDSVWLDSRNASANNTDSQLFYSCSKNGGLTWSANVAVSNAFDPFLGYPNQNTIGSYISLVSDNTGANVAYTATFNGGQDVYYVRVAAAPVPDYSLAISPSSQSVPRAGGSVSYTVAVTPVDGFSSPVSLSVSGLPSGATAKFNPTTATPGGYSTLTVTVGSSTSQGTYPFTVTGNGGSPTITRTATATLIKAKQ